MMEFAILVDKKCPYGKNELREIVYPCLKKKAINDMCFKKEYFVLIKRQIL